MRKIVGIDLGPTFSAIGHVNESSRPKVIPNTEGERITPSMILFDNELSLTIQFIQGIIEKIYSQKAGPQSYP